MAYPAGDATIHTDARITPNASGHVSLACGPYNRHNFAVLTARRLQAFNKDESEPNFIRILPWGGKTCGESCIDACGGAMSWYAVVAGLFVLTVFEWLGNGGPLSYFSMVSVCLALIWNITTLVIIHVNESRFKSHRAWYLMKVETDENHDDAYNAHESNKFQIIPTNQESFTFRGIELNEDQRNVLQSKLFQSHVPEVQVMFYNKWYLRACFEIPSRSIIFLSFLYIVNLILHGASFIHTA